eukprot:GFUD01092100.1.p1 GENE.GFUD01092100.1~~GFUD01092100.1.p1  ORF type:complete len:176 (-),score=39.19 GFUD01092100.1:144-671(-)
MFRPDQICIVLLSISFLQVSSKPQTNFGDGQDFNGLLNDPNIQVFLNNLGGQDVTGLLNNANTPNLQEILKNIDSENLNLDNIDLGPHRDVIEKAVNIIKVSSPEDLGDLSEAIEANPDSLPILHIDPEIVAEWIKSEANRMATISPPQVIQSGSSRAALSLFFSFCLIFKITSM